MAVDQAVLNGMGTDPFLDQPSVHLLDHRRLGPVDLQVLRRRFAFGHATIAVGWPPAPVDPSLAGGEQAPPAGPFLDQGAFILGEHALHLEQHLLFRAGVEGVVEEDHLAARAPELFKQNGLVGEVTGQAIRRTDQHGGAGALADPVAQPIQGRPVQAGSAEAIVHEDEILGQPQIALGRPSMQGVQLAVDGLVLLLPVRRHPGVGRRQAHRDRGARAADGRADVVGSAPLRGWRARRSRAWAIRRGASQHGTLSPTHSVVLATEPVSADPPAGAAGDGIGGLLAPGPPPGQQMTSGLHRTHRPPTRGGRSPQGPRRSHSGWTVSKTTRFCFVNMPLLWRHPCLTSTNSFSDVDSEPSPSMSMTMSKSVIDACDDHTFLHA